MSITTQGVCAGYPGFGLKEVTLELPTGGLTALIGPNGCGKSTLLKTLVGLLRVEQGRIHVSGQDLHAMSPRQTARQIALLPQHPVVPPGITVEQLVQYGRAPHQNLLGMMARTDHRFVEEALDWVGLTELRKERPEHLSGGQRQRAFIAMCIAQATPYILFDEPTSFLDIKYQYEVLSLIRSLTDAGKTCVAVLHDIGQAARYADWLVVMKDGQVHTSTPPDRAITESMVREVYGIDAHVYPDPMSGTQVVTPRTGGAHTPQIRSPLFSGSVDGMVVETSTGTDKAR